MFIINPKAGAMAGGPSRPGRDRVATVTETIRRVLSEEVGIFEIKVTQGPGGGELYSRDAVTRGFDAVFACGGDGTVNEVATPLVDTSTALGIIPFGSGNGFARALNIPENPVEAISR